MTTLNKINVKGVEYNLGGSGGEEIKSMQIPLEFKNIYEEDDIYHEGDILGIEGILQLSINEFDYSRGIVIDFFDKNGNWLHCMTYAMNYGAEDIYIRDMIQNGDIYAMLGSMYLESSGDTYYWEAPHAGNESYIEFYYDGSDDDFRRFLRKTTKVIVYGYPVTKASPTVIYEL